jgi:hypothetical protein
VSIKAITLGCDVTDCRAYFQAETSSQKTARERAARRGGWTRSSNGGDICGPCSAGEEPHR